MFRPIVSSRRVQHTDSDTKLVLDLAYVVREPVTIIVMSMPALSFPATLYRNSLQDIRKFLNAKHQDWAIFEFRGEGTGYQDSDFEGHAVYHFQFPDHQAAPFHVYLDVVEQMRAFFEAHKDGAAVLHCKAGKGRSGSMSCAYMILQLGKTAAEARDIFTRARMNPSMGQGVSIRSQRRYLDYLEQWRDLGRKPLPDVQVLVESVVLFEVRSGIQVSIGGYDKPGKDGIHRYRNLYTFNDDIEMERKGALLILRPKTPIQCHVDACVQVTRGHSAVLGQIPTSIAQGWFNGYFESLLSEPHKFALDWEECDGLKGSNKRGIKVLDRIEVTFSLVAQSKDVHT